MCDNKNVIFLRLLTQTNDVRRTRSQLDSHFKWTITTDRLTQRVVPLTNNIHIGQSGIDTCQKTNDILGTRSPSIGWVQAKLTTPLFIYSKNVKSHKSKKVIHASVTKLAYWNILDKKTSRITYNLFRLWNYLYLWEQANKKPTIRWN